jgi:hypothetical protein
MPRENSFNRLDFAGREPLWKVDRDRQMAGRSEQELHWKTGYHGRWKGAVPGGGLAFRGVGYKTGCDPAHLNIRTYCTQAPARTAMLFIPIGIGVCYKLSRAGRCLTANAGAGG